MWRSLHKIPIACDSKSFQAGEHTHILEGQCTSTPQGQMLLGLGPSQTSPYVSLHPYSLTQRSPTFWHQGPVSWKTIFPGGDGFGMIQVHYIYNALYFYYYDIVIYDEIIIQLTIMQNQWEPWACSHLPLTDRVLIWACKQLIYYGFCAVRPPC